MPNNNSQGGGYFSGLSQNFAAGAIAGIGGSLGALYLGPIFGGTSEFWQTMAAAAGLVLLVGVALTWRAIKRSANFVRRKLSSVSGKGDRLTIVIAALKNDESGELAGRIELSLEQQLGRRVEVIRRPEMIAIGEHGSLEDRRRAVEQAGQDLLKRAQGDLLIWGAALRQDKVIDLNFLPREHSGGQTKSYTLDSTLRLPENFGSDLGAAIAGVAAIAAAPIFKDAGKYFVPVLRPAMARLSHLVESPPAGLNGDSRASIFQAFALICGNLGEQTGDNDLLDKSVTAFREALKEWTRERVPHDWAITQNNLGAALTSLGERESGTARLEEAVTAFREALKERTRERVPLDWATTQNNLGNALTSLGEREGGTARLEEAVTAFREALKEYTRERVPLNWAMTQNNLGNALASLGERESGTAQLEEAVTAFREALKEYTRERVPLDWATTQNNLGNALRRLGERESGTARLEETVTAFCEALEEFEAAGADHYIEVARRNLARAEKLLQERQTK